MSGPRSSKIVAQRRRLARAPRRLSLLFRALAIAIPLGVLVFSATASPADLARAIGVPSPISVGMPSRIAVVILALLPAVGTALALESLRRCALAIQEGRGLTLDVARSLRHAASFMLVSSAAALVVPTLAGILLSLSSGKLTVTVHLGAEVALPLVLAGALRLISGVVMDAAALADEHAQIV